MADGKSPGPSATLPSPSTVLPSEPTCRSRSSSQNFEDSLLLYIPPSLLKSSNDADAHRIAGSAEVSSVSGPASGSPASSGAATSSAKGSGAPGDVGAGAGDAKGAVTTIDAASEEVFVSPSGRLCTGSPYSPSTASGVPMSATPEFLAVVKQRLDAYSSYLKDRTEHHLGYPYNLKFTAEPLAPFLQFSINNLGDPFNESNYGVHSREFEVEVLNFFADLWHIPRDAYWGYTTCCGTEGNLLGVLYGRECHPAGVLYCSVETHYSVPKAAAMYRMPAVRVPTQPSGQMDYVAFEAKLKENLDKPAIVVLNAGTTVKGAVDCIDVILEILSSNGFERDRFYIHVDGALSGLVQPFVAGRPVDDQFHITFEKPIDSVSISGHKMLGCPMPCGVVVTRKEHMERYGRDIEYLNSTDTTIMGSRNGQASLFMWYALMTKGVEGLSRDVAHCVDTARMLRSLFAEGNVSAMLNVFSTTVVFQRPSEEIVRKWQLACVGSIAHVVVMPSTTEGQLREFFEEYMGWHRSVSSHACVAVHIGEVSCLCEKCVHITRETTKPAPVSDA